MRKINYLLVPLLNKGVPTFIKINFPEMEIDEQTLVNIPEPEIVASLNTSFELIGHSNDSVIYEYDISETYNAKCFTAALQRYHSIVFGAESRSQ